MKHRWLAACLIAASAAVSARADNARFDLVGPKVDVRVTRGGATLPIAQVPNLLPGDKIWIKADLPDTQSNHLFLVVAFLRGTTNQPPDSWFTEIDTWDKRTREGTTVTVPEGAEQALMFIAPETGGDFKTLRSAVKGRPGLFIRADSDLSEASFEQQRIERYLAAMKMVSGDDPKAIQDHSSKLAATLALKPNADCFKQPVEQQVNCLTQSSAPVLLSDGHGQTVAEALSTGASSDFINAASYTQAAGGGTYSAYVGAVVDLVHLVSTLHTAQYQYIPGLSFPQGSTLNLKLNAPPSFINPKSVIVIGLPAIQKAKLPPLKPQHPDQIACLLDPKMALQLDGAPLVFATSFAHDLVLHLNRPGTDGQDIPLTPDAFEGGLIVGKAPEREPLKDVGPSQGNASDERADAPSEAKPAPKAQGSELTITGTVRGYWGFDPFSGPTLTLQQVDGKDWKVVGNTQLLAGKDNKLALEGDGTACVQHIALTNDKNENVNVSFKPDTGDGGKETKNKLDLDVSLKQVQPGGYSLAIAQFGDKKKDTVPLTAYNADIHLDALKIHAGDTVAVLTGQGLGSVASVELDGQTFTPAQDGSDDKNLQLQAKAGVSPKDGDEATAKLKDGRTMQVKVSAEAPRPEVKLLSLTASPAQEKGAMPVQLSGKDEIPLQGRLTFVVQSKQAFPRDEKVEVATADGSVHTTLSLAANSLVLQDANTAVAMLDPLKAFGESAFGQLRMRPVAADGTPGDWTPLGVLVRTPQITSVQCTTTAAPTCSLNGNNLFLVQSFAGAKDYAKPDDVPLGFAQGTFTVPTPTDGSTLYMKLRDDPKEVASITLPAPVPQPAQSPAQPPGPNPSAPPASQPASPPSSPSASQPAPAGSASPAPPGAGAVQPASASAGTGGTATPAASEGQPAAVSATPPAATTATPAANSGSESQNGAAPAAPANQGSNPTSSPAAPASTTAPATGSALAPGAAQQGSKTPDQTGKAAPRTPPAQTSPQSSPQADPPVNPQSR